MLFFSFDPNGAGFIIHESAEEAMAEANAVIEMEREFSQEGWDENVKRICWGSIYQIAQEVHRKDETNTSVDYIIQDCIKKGA